MGLYFKYGKPVMVAGTPGAAYASGDVVVYNGVPLVAHAANPPFGSTVILDALAACGGVYTGPADGAYKVGTYVHWDPTASKFTTQGGGNTVPFGYIVGGPNGDFGDGGPTADGSLCDVLHLPITGGIIPEYSAVAASTAVTNTTVETLFDKSVTLPADALRPGDVIKVRAQVIATATNSTDTLTLKLYIGGLTGTAVVSTGAVDVANGDIGYIDAEIVVRDVGATGHIVAAGVQALGVPGTVTAKPFLLGSTVIDTTAAKVIGVSATWSVANAGNSCRLDVLNVQIVRK